MATEQRHIIKKQILDLEFHSTSDGFALQREVSELYKEKVLPQLSEVFDELVGPNTILRIQRLQVDLGDLNREDLERDFAQNCLRAIERELRLLSHIAESEAPLETKVLSKEHSVLEVFRIFLESGMLPWFAAPEVAKDLQGAVLKAFQQDGTFELESIKALLRLKESAVRRLIWEFSPSLWNRLLELLVKKDLAKAIRDQETDLVAVWRSVKLSSIPESKLLSDWWTGVFRELAANNFPTRESKSLFSKMIQAWSFEIVEKDHGESLLQALRDKIARKRKRKSKLLSAKEIAAVMDEVLLKHTQQAALADSEADEEFPAEKKETLTEDISKQERKRAKKKPEARKGQKRRKKAIEEESTDEWTPEDQKPEKPLGKKREDPAAKIEKTEKDQRLKESLATGSEERNAVEEPTHPDESKLRKEFVEEKPVRPDEGIEPEEPVGAEGTEEISDVKPPPFPEDKETLSKEEDIKQEIPVAPQVEVEEDKAEDIEPAADRIVDPSGRKEPPVSTDKEEDWAEEQKVIPEIKETVEEIDIEEDTKREASLDPKDIPLKEELEEKASAAEGTSESLQVEESPAPSEEAVDITEEERSTPVREQETTVETDLEEEARQKALLAAKDDRSKEKFEKKEPEMESPADSPELEVPTLPSEEEITPLLEPETEEVVDLEDNIMEEQLEEVDSATKLETDFLEQEPPSVLAEGKVEKEEPGEGEIKLPPTEISEEIETTVKQEAAFSDLETPSTLSEEKKTKKDEDDKPAEGEIVDEEAKEVKPTVDSPAETFEIKEPSRPSEKEDLPEEEIKKIVPRKQEPETGREAFKEKKSPEEIPSKEERTEMQEDEPLKPIEPVEEKDMQEVRKEVTQALEEGTEEGELVVEKGAEETSLFNETEMGLEEEGAKEPEIPEQEKKAPPVKSPEELKERSEEGGIIDKVKDKPYLDKDEDQPELEKGQEEVPSPETTEKEDTFTVPAHSGLSEEEEERVEKAWEEWKESFEKGEIKRDKPTKKKPVRKRTVARDKEGYYVNNAGIIILGPFLPRFFENLELQKEGAFTNKAARQRAIRLLHYLATFEEQSAEYMLVLHKALCGLPLEDPIENDFVISDRERAEAKSLLESVLELWGALKETSPEGLQQAFLQRKGKLSYEEEPTPGWKLQVERKAIDILLEMKAPPWSYSVVKLPWMDYLIRVEWG